MSEEVQLPDAFLEQIGNAIPAYLTPEKKEDLLKGIKDFPKNMEYYLPPEQFSDEILQGDIWYDFQIINFLTTERKNVKGIILSNSCDISTENPRYSPITVSFVPLLRVSKLHDHLTKIKNKVSADSIIEGIISQSNTQYFYLPKSRCNTVEDNFIADLTNIHTLPIDYVQKNSTKRLSLSMIGFYLLLVKISMHLCRFNERVDR